MGKDFLNSPLLLERLKIWHKDPSERNIELIVTEHFMPFCRQIVCKAIWLNREEQDDAIQDAVIRCQKSLGTYDPQRYSPFKYFFRIAINERHRESGKKKKARERNPISVNELANDDSGEFDTLDRLTSSQPVVDNEAFGIFQNIKDLSPLHDRVFSSMHEGHGLRGISQLRPK